MFDADRFPFLTARERQIATAALAGHTSAAIAAELSLSRRTVENHLANIYRKLRIGNRRELGELVALGESR